MAGRRSFKSDERFLELISMGAMGTRHVLDDLRDQGHTPIELERGSTSFKIWKAIKIKRIRVPDILCTECGKRVESRAKTKLDISMSHSFSDPIRGWDYGLNDDDFVALVACRRSGDRPIDWVADDLTQYVKVQSLREAFRADMVQGSSPKGAQEGFESRLVWPASVATVSGTVVTVTNERLQYRRDSDNGVTTLSLIRKGGVELKPLVKEGDRVVENQVLASVVDVSSDFPCPQTATEQTYITALGSASLSERYAAAKALSHFFSTTSTEALAERVKDKQEHIYVRLEAAASLSRREDERGFSFIEQCLGDNYLEHRLETVIVLGEIGTNRSSQLLTRVLKDTEQHPEIRAGAAWALGERRDQGAINALIGSFLDVEEEIKIEAARALAKLAERDTPDIVEQFTESEPLKRPGIAWALSNAGEFSIQHMLNSLVDDNARRWVAYMIGTQDQQQFVRDIEVLRTKDSEVYFAVTVLWQIMSSWIYELEEY